jgi:hypothetical protein
MTSFVDLNPETVVQLECMLFMRLRCACLLYHPTLEMQDLLAMTQPVKVAVFGSAVISAEKLYPHIELKNMSIVSAAYCLSYYTTPLPVHVAVLLRY